VNISEKSPTHSELEIGHVLFMDVVGYSKLLVNEQREILEGLTRVVRESQHFQAAETAGKLIRLPVGDGMALVFFNTHEAPAQCALEIAEALKAQPELKLRMGIHSGPVSGVTDVNDRSNVAGAGINMAQRVMDCGDAGHILLSKRAADDLAQDARWRPQLHELGECLVKHGTPVSVVSLYNDHIGNPQLPEKIKTARRTKAAATLRRRSLFAGIGILLTAALAFLIYKRQPFRSATPEPGWEKSVAVLPLENLSEEKENAYFADGIQDELLSDLAKIKDLKVISRTSVMQYKTGITRNLKEIAQQLGVSNIVEGSVRRSGNHMRVSVQLIDALTDRHLWAQNYDRTVADSVTLQGELATQIASEVGATISPQEKARLSVTPTKNTAAYDAYLRGRALEGEWMDDYSNFQKAAEAYQEAVTLDPNFVLAWVYLSAAHSSLYWNGVDHTPKRLAAAKEAADRAITLDPNLPEIHLALGYYRYYALRDFKGALAEFQLAEKSLPNDAGILHAMGLIHRRLGHYDEVIAVMRRAFELDPRNIQSAGILATCYGAKRNFSDAMAVADHILAIEPANLQAISLKLECFWGLENLEGADRFLAKINAPVHIRAHQAIAARRWAEAADLLSKVWSDKPPENQRPFILLDIGIVQQHIGNIAASKATYQQAVQEFTQALAKVGAEANDELHAGMGSAYAGLGDAPHAISEGQKAMAVHPTSEDPFEGPLQEEAMAQIYAALGNADESIPILKRWVHVPSYTSIAPTFLRIDPAWDRIRDDPRFQELCH
jgi:TolB-like protein/Flp pilus assembly protein TadD